MPVVIYQDTSFYGHQSSSEQSDIHDCSTWQQNNVHNVWDFSHRHHNVHNQCLPKTKKTA